MTDLSLHRQKRIEFLSRLIFLGVSPEELEGKTLVELRDLMDQMEPTKIISRSVTPSGGIKTTTTIISNKAA